MGLRALRHRLEYGLFRLATRWILAHSHGGVRRMGRRMGRLFFRLGRRRRRLVLSNLALVFPERAEEERLDIARRCFEHFGGLFFESVSASRFDPANIQDWFEIVGWERLKEAEARGKGVLVMTGHFGSWELAAFPLAHRLGRLDIVVRPQNNPLVAADLKVLREKWGNVLISRYGAAHSMLNALRRRGRVALTIDQRVMPREGELLEFLGHPAWTSTVPAFLSLYTGAPVVPVFCEPAPDGRYRMEVEPAILPEGEGPEAEIALTRRYLEAVESRIRRRPELWFWMHRRWDTRIHYHYPSRLREIARDSGLPPASPESESWPSAPRALRRALGELASGAFLARPTTLAFIGPSGSGKTRAACALGHALVRAGTPVRFAAAGALGNELAEARRSGRLGTEIRKLDQVELLVLDGLDTDRGPSEAGRALASLLEHRQDRRSTLVTSRQPPSEWGRILGPDSAAATAFESGVLRFGQ